MLYIYNYNVYVQTPMTSSLFSFSMLFKGCVITNNNYNQLLAYLYSFDAVKLTRSYTHEAYVFYTLNYKLLYIILKYTL